jgi:hypothetical protein
MQQHAENAQAEVRVVSSYIPDKTKKEYDSCNVLLSTLGPEVEP